MHHQGEHRGLNAPLRRGDEENHAGTGKASRWLHLPVTGPLSEYPSVIK